MISVTLNLNFYGVPPEIARRAAQELIEYVAEEYANRRLPETAQLLERHNGDVWGWEFLRTKREED